MRSLVEAIGKGPPFDSWASDTRRGSPPRGRGPRPPRARLPVLGGDRARDFEHRARAASPDVNHDHRALSLLRTGRSESSRPDAWFREDVALVVSGSPPGPDLTIVRRLLADAARLSPMGLNPWRSLGALHWTATCRPLPDLLHAHLIADERSDGATSNGLSGDEWARSSASSTGQPIGRRPRPRWR